MDDVIFLDPADEARFRKEQTERAKMWARIELPEALKPLSVLWRNGEAIGKRLYFRRIFERRRKQPQGIHDPRYMQ